MMLAAALRQGPRTIMLETPSRQLPAAADAILMIRENERGMCREESGEVVVVVGFQ